MTMIMKIMITVIIIIITNDDNNDNNDKFSGNNNSSDNNNHFDIKDLSDILFLLVIINTCNKVKK